MIKITKKTNPQSFGNMFVVCTKQNFLVIDPCVGFESIKPLVKNKNCVGVFLTHAHFDHFAEIESFLSQGFNIFLSKHAETNMQNPNTNVSLIFGKSFTAKVPKQQLKIVKEGDIIKFENLEAKVLELFGHTNCSIGLVLENHFFCGDFIFEDSNIGRCDLPTGSPLEMRNSLRKLKNLDENTIVHSGHGNDFLLKDFTLLKKN